jgi:hypothetical protein
MIGDPSQVRCWVSLFLRRRRLHEAVHPNLFWPFRLSWVLSLYMYMSSATVKKPWNVYWCRKVDKL